METHFRLLKIVRHRHANIVETRNVVILPLLLLEQAKPSLKTDTGDLWDGEWKGAHEIIPRRSIPIPHLDG